MGNSKNRSINNGRSISSNCIQATHQISSGGVESSLSVKKNNNHVPARSYSNISIYCDEHKNNTISLHSKTVRAGNYKLIENDKIKIDWIMTMRCNYSCSYCNVPDNKSPLIDFKKLKNAADNLIKLKNNRIEITLSGGEPTIHPDYIQFLEYLFQKDPKRISVCTITNLSMPFSFYEKIMGSSVISSSNLRFASSYHLEYAKPDKFIQNAKFLSDSGFKVHLLLLAHPEHMNYVKSLFTTLNKFSSEKLKVDLKLVREKFGSYPDKRYTKKDLEWLNKNYEENSSKNILTDIMDAEQNIIRQYFGANEIVSKGLNKYKGMLCHAGVNMLTIDKNGFIAPAVCLRGKIPCKVNIFQQGANIEKLNKPITCPFDACGCIGDIHLPKYLPGYENINYNPMGSAIKASYNNDQVDHFTNSETRTVLDQALNVKGWQSKGSRLSKYFDSCTYLKNIQKPSISIIVIPWRLHPDTIKNFIKNFEILEKQRDQNFELIFVENGGKPGEFDELKPYVDNYVRLNTNTGAYLARNIGAVFAKAPILFFLKDDGIPAENIVQAHIDAHDKYDVIAVRGVYQPKSGNIINSLAKHYFLGEQPYPRFGDLEGNVSYKADIYFQAGGWDDNIKFGHGGIDLSYRLLKIDPDMRKQIYSPAPVIFHDYAVDENHLVNKREKQSQSWEYLRGKHGTSIDRFLACWDRFIGQENAILRKNNKAQSKTRSMENLAEYYLRKGKKDKAEVYSRMANSGKP